VEKCGGAREATDDSNDTVRVLCMLDKYCYKDTQNM
jgi:hypothetical protein